MEQADFDDLEKKLLDAARESTDEFSLLNGFREVIREYSARFPAIGGPLSLYSASMFFFSNKGEHFSFFPSFCRATFDELGRVGYWDRASLVSERMVGYQIEVFKQHKSNLESKMDWFNRWKSSTENWFEASVNDESWNQLGTGLFIRCEDFSSSPELSDHVHEFWSSMIEKYGRFTLLDSKVENLNQQVSEFAQITMRDADSSYPIKEILANKVKLLEKVDAGEVVDQMNKLIALAPRKLTSEEIEMAKIAIKSSDNLFEACHESNNLATELRVAGQLKDAIDVLKSIVEHESYDVSYDEMALSSMKLGIYLDEAGDKEGASGLFQTVADEEPQFEEKRISVRTVMDACHRYSTLLHDAEKYEDSKLYSIREHHLSEQVGDPFQFVRSCFNIANDCRLLEEQKEALQWYELGMMNLKDACVNPGYTTPNPMGALLIEQSKNLAIILGHGEEKWNVLIQHIFSESV